MGITGAGKEKGCERKRRKGQGRKERERREGEGRGMELEEERKSGGSFVVIYGQLCNRKNGVGRYFHESY